MKILRIYRNIVLFLKIEDAIKMKYDQQKVDEPAAEPLNKRKENEL